MQSANFGSFSNDPSPGVALPSSPLDTYPDLGKPLNLSATLSLASGAAYQNLTPIERQASSLRERMLPFRGPDYLLGAGNYALYGKSTNQTKAVRTILGTAGRDTINTVNRAVAVGDRLQILARGAADTVKVGIRTSAYGEAGNDVLDARLGRGSNYLYGNAGADTLYARTNDFLFGGDGNDTLWAGSGRNRLTGGTGADRFWLGNGSFPSAVNTILDFNPAADLLMIRNLPGVRSFADISLVQQGTGTRILAAGRAIAVLNNVLPSRLRAANFRISTNDPLVPAPTITAGLVSDTGASASDFITQTATITGQVGGQRLSRFEIKADNGSFVDFTNQLNNGQFTLTPAVLDTLSGGTLNNGPHTLQFRATNDQNTATVRNFTFTLDTVAPSNPTLNAPGVTASTTEPYTFTVTYTDNQAIQVGSLGDGDVRVTGPGSFSQSATLVSVDTNSDGATRTATYQIIPPGNGWDLAENGSYTVEVLGNQVSDVAGNSLTASTLGTFNVNIPLNLNVGLTSDTGASNTDKVTTTAGITGSIQGSGFSALEISVNGGSFQPVTNSVTNGNFAFTAAQLATFNGGPLTSGANTIVLRATTTQSTVTEQTLNFVLDTSAPTAAVTAANVTAASNTYSFTVNFADDNAIDVSTLSNGDVRVTGPGGFNQLANLVDVDLNSDGTPRTATFQITPPGGDWNLADNGTYTVALVASGVSDVAGNQNAAATLGNFTVNLPSAPTVTVGLTNDTGVSNTDGLTNSVGVTGQVTGSGISQLQVRLDNGNFVDVTSALNVNTGAFTLTSAQVIAAASGTLANGAHTLTIRATNGQGSTDSTLNFTFDTQLPRVQSVNAANALAAGGANYTFTITFNDTQAVDVATLDNGDVQVTGPNGFSQVASFVSSVSGLNGARIATYRITVPGGSWDLAENGLYTLSIAVNQVRDTAGNAIAASTAGYFSVLVPSRINFQPVASAAPAGYAVDSGLGFDATRGYGWVTQGTSNALDISARVFDRAQANIEARLDTVALMQSNGTAAATAAAWEYTLPNGRYSVTVSVGDFAGGSNQIVRAEGTTVVPSFNTTTTGGIPSYFKLATATVDVVDGRLTLDAIGGTDTRINFVEIVPINPGDHPSVLSSPLANATNVNRRAAINISDLSLFGVGEGVDGTTLTSATIQIYRTRDGAVVASNFNTSGGNDTIIIQPQSILDPNTQYTVRISDGVKDLGGRTFLPYSLTFTTGNEATAPTDGVNFTQSIVFGQNTSNDAPISTLLMSPDNRFLYGSALDGSIYRWTVQADGTLTGQQTFTMPRGSLANAPELIGIAFDPNNSNVLWVVQNTATSTPDAVDFSGKIVRLTLTGGDAAFTATAQDYIVGLPRSGRDHFGNSLRFGPDGKLYLTQGSNTSAGVADSAWGMRPERLLTAAMLQIDPTRTPPTGGFNVQTEGLGANNYDPYATNAVLKIYASGLRNSYDFVFHSNGTLYAPVNGSGGGGITPDDPNTAANEGLTNVSSRPDYVYRILEGEYYGHPNPSRGEYIMAGGNPTVGLDPEEVAGTAGVSGYAVGTLPDPDYQTALFTFGTSRAPTGVLEYQSNTFNGRLRNRLIVTEYSSGDDIVVLEIDPATGNITGSSILGGGSVNPDWGMANPVDIIENTSNGNLYVAELYPQGFGATAVTGRIRLIRPA
ncbi:MULTISPECIES: Ig-like domain-containing protein [unclassified Leptolyngbya]|uniref:Ig-like domain-containing protein n=1 Tax=unclassified Leptolyngbya TaxID=2650499 RepID=UPI0016831BA3|nr:MULTISPECIES: Ig-like domain-containing protein [unclassified Leptolyngbya]MBD1910119.1 Ig-like domain-containing protein [Leptolyngbya sp. FACHB-8]MBD2156891.1 Ig-like domain-containing protein [Leptolyngbya sp. FACHB-16]